MNERHLGERLSKRELEGKGRCRTGGDGKLLRTEQTIEIALQLRPAAREIRHEDADPCRGGRRKSRSHPRRARCCLIPLALRGVKGRRGKLFHLPGKHLLLRASRFQGGLQGFFGGSCAIPEDFCQHGLDLFAHLAEVGIPDNQADAAWSAFHKIVSAVEHPVYASLFNMNAMNVVRIIEGRE